MGARWPPRWSRARNADRADGLVEDEPFAERLGDQMRARARAGLVHRVARVGADGVVGDVKHVGDLRARVAERDQVEDLALAIGQRPQHVGVEMAVAPEVRPRERGAERDEQHEALAGADLDRRAPVRAHDAAVGGDHRDVSREPVFAEVLAPFLLGDQRAVLDDLPHVFADELAAAVAQQPQVGAVDLALAPLGVEQHHRVARLRERGREQPGPAVWGRHRRDPTAAGLSSESPDRGEEAVSERPSSAAARSRIVAASTRATSGGEVAVQEPQEITQDEAGGSRLHRARRVLHHARGLLAKRALHRIGFLIFVYLFLKLIPGFADALDSLRGVSLAWIAGAIFVETLSQCGYVVSWTGILDPEGLLRAEGRGRHLGARVAWSQLGGGMLVPGGTIGSMGVGAWMLHRLGMPMSKVGERQFTLMFLNTGVDALAV